MTKIIAIGDTHWDATERLHWSYRLVKSFIKAEQFDEVVHLGDLLDLSYLSSFNKGKLRALEGHRYRKDLMVMERELKDLLDYTGKLTVLEGNHDERVHRFLDESPFFEGLLEYENLEIMQNKQVTWVPQREQPIALGDLFLCHGWWAPLYAARKHVEQVGGNVIFGHTHRRHFWSKVLWGMNREMNGWGVGCLSDHAPDWLKGKPSGWQYDFLVIYLLPGGEFRVFPVFIENGFFVWNGKIWRRRNDD